MSQPEPTTMEARIPRACSSNPEAKGGIASTSTMKTVSGGGGDSPKENGNATTRREELRAWLPDNRHSQQHQGWHSHPSSWNVRVVLFRAPGPRRLRCGDALQGLRGAHLLGKVSNRTAVELNIFVL